MNTHTPTQSIEAPKCGLGVRLRHSHRGLLSVASILPGGAADASGLLRENDQVCSIFKYVSMSTSSGVSI